MARYSKWITGTSPEQAATEVATRAVRARVDAVWFYARRAAKRPEQDIEHVHQLRVATRRARAAFGIFADVLPDQDARWLKKQLRSLRRAAGDARDLDVLGDRLTATAAAEKSHCLDPVIRRIAAARKNAQKPLIKAYKKAKSGRFRRRSRQFADSLSWHGEQPEPTFAELARATLGRLVLDFFSAAADVSDVESLHQMRIEGKHVRYAMELLAGAFDPLFRKSLYPTFVEVQEKLGTINDHATAIRTLTDWRERTSKKRTRAVLSRLIRQEEQQLKKKCRSFRAWWTTERVNELKERFDAFLSEARPAGTAKKRQRAPSKRADQQAQSNGARRTRTKAKKRSATR